MHSSSVLPGDLLLLSCSDSPLPPLTTTPRHLSMFSSVSRHWTTQKWHQVPATQGWKEGEPRFQENFPCQLGQAIVQKIMWPLERLRWVIEVLMRSRSSAASWKSLKIRACSFLSQLGVTSQKRRSLSQGPAISVMRRRGGWMKLSSVMREHLGSESFGLPCLCLLGVWCSFYFGVWGAWLKGFQP